MARHCTGQSDHTGPGAAQERVTTQDQELHTVEYIQRSMCVCPRGCVGRLGRKGCTPYSRLRKLSVDYRESVLQMNTVSSERKRFLFHQPSMSSRTARHSHSGDTGHSEMWLQVQDDLSLSSLISISLSGSPNTFFSSALQTMGLHGECTSSVL